MEYTLNRLKDESEDSDEDEAWDETIWTLEGAGALWDVSGSPCAPSKHNCSLRKAQTRF